MSLGFLFKAVSSMISVPFRCQCRRRTRQSQLIKYERGALVPCVTWGRLILRLLSRNVKRGRELNLKACHTFCQATPPLQALLPLTFPHLSSSCKWIQFLRASFAFSCLAASCFMPKKSCQVSCSPKEKAANGGRESRRERGVEKGRINY